MRLLQFAFQCLLPTHCRHYGQQRGKGRTEIAAVVGCKGGAFHLEAGAARFIRYVARTA